MPQFRRGRQCGRPRARRIAAHSHGGRTKKKLFMIAMAAAFSMAMVAQGFAQTTTTTPPATEKKEEKKAAKAEKKAAKDEAKAEKKEEKKAANPCAAKAEKK